MSPTPITVWSKLVEQDRHSTGCSLAQRQGRTQGNCVCGQGKSVLVVARLDFANFISAVELSDVLG